MDCDLIVDPVVPLSKTTWTLNAYKASGKRKKNAKNFKKRKLHASDSKRAVIRKKCFRPSTDPVPRADPAEYELLLERHYAELKAKGHRRGELRP